MPMRLRAVLWKFYWVIWVSLMVWMEIRIQVQFARGREILREIQEIQGRIEVHLHGHED
jgi:hypothetical protein